MKLLVIVTQFEDSSISYSLGADKRGKPFECYGKYHKFKRGPLECSYTRKGKNPLNKYTPAEMEKILNQPIDGWSIDPVSNIGTGHLYVDV